MNIVSLIDEAVKVRESGRLASSRKLFDKLLNKIDKSNPDYLRLKGEYVIQLRLEGKELTSQALKLGQELVSTYPQEPSAIRALAHSLIDLGGFELAESLLNKLIESYSANSLKKGEEQAHLAYVYLRIGKPAAASGLITQAIENIKNNTAHENYVEVRQSYAFIVKSLIENATNQKQDAVQSAAIALDIATKGSSPFRIAQAKELLTLYTNN